MSVKKLLKIGEVAKKTGVTLRTIRYYDELGLIHPVERTSGNFRLYEESAIAIIKLISNLKTLEFSLEEIKDLLVPSDCSDDDYIKTINRTKKILLEKKKKVNEKLNYYNSLAEEIDNSVETIEKCVECRKKRGNQEPCKPGCKNYMVHIKI